MRAVMRGGGIDHWTQQAVLKAAKERGVDCSSLDYTEWCWASDARRAGMLTIDEVVDAIEVSAAGARAYGGGA